MAEDTSIMSEPSRMSPPSPATTSSSTSITTEQLAAEMAKLRQELNEKDDTISQLNEHILSLETEGFSTSSHNKKRKFSNSAQPEEEDEQLFNLRNENEQLKKRIDELERPSTTNETTNCQCKHTTTTADSTTDIVKIIEEKLSIGLSAIKENVNKLIETKLNNVQTPTNDAIPVDPTQYSYASAVGKNHVNGNLKTIMMATKNEEITEQAEKKRRGRSIMVFGRGEHTSERWKKLMMRSLLSNFSKTYKLGQSKPKK